MQEGSSGRKSKQRATPSKQNVFVKLGKFNK